MNTKIPIPKKITAQWLRDLGACDDVVSEFAKLFPRGAKPCLKTLTASPEFDLDYLATLLLTGKSWTKYARITRLTWVECQMQRDLATYQRAGATALLAIVFPTVEDADA